MPILSYLAYPVEGRGDDLRRDLGAFDECALIPAANRDLFVLTTETRSIRHEKRLQKRLKDVPSLGCLALVFGHADPDEAGPEVDR